MTVYIYWPNEYTIEADSVKKLHIDKTVKSGKLYCSDGTVFECTAVDTGFSKLWKMTLIQKGSLFIKLFPISYLDEVSSSALLDEGITDIRFKPCS